MARFVWPSFVLACSSGPLTIANEPLQGVIDGEPWTLGSGETDAILSDADRLFGILHDDANATPCDDPPEGPQLGVFLPAETGTYSFDETNLTATFAFGEGDNVIATEGVLRIDEISVEDVVGGLHVRADRHNEVDGEFVLERCYGPITPDQLVDQQFVFDVSQGEGVFAQTLFGSALPAELVLRFTSLSAGQLEAEIVGFDTTFAGPWSNPGFELASDALTVDIPGSSVVLDEPRLEGSVERDASALVDTTLTFRLDVRDLPMSDTLCELLALNAEPCTACGDGVVACADGVIEGLRGEKR